MMSITVRAAPSLAVMKYWGKQHIRRNTPATTSIGMSLSDWYVEVSLHEKTSHEFSRKADDRMYAFLQEFCRRYRIDACYEIQTKGTVPYAAGFAGSSAAFAALAAACSKLLSRTLSPFQLSALARKGSASAARSVFGGFSILPAGGRCARPLWKADHWPQLRILCVQVDSEKKSISSREAMHISRNSPFYRDWLRNSRRVEDLFLEAIANRDLEKLGQAMQQNTYCMFAVMLSSHPPVRYWQAGTMTVLSVLEDLRKEGYGAWETMDAGPQVKVLVEEGEAAAVSAAITQALPDVKIDTLRVAHSSLQFR